MRFLESIKSKSPAVKGQIAFWSAFLVVLAIGFMWSTSLPVRFAETEIAQQKEDAPEDGPFRDMVAGVRMQLGALGSAFTREANTEDPEAPAAVPSPTLNFETTTPPVDDTRVILIATSTDERSVE